MPEDVAPDDEPKPPNARLPTVAETSERPTGIFVALIALLGAILAGGIGAGASIVTANVSAESQNEQSIAEYRRDLRRETYGEILAKMTTLEDVLSTYQFKRGLIEAVIAADPDQENRQIRIDFEDDWRPAYDSLRLAVSNAELIGSDRVINIARTIRYVYHRTFIARLLDPDLIDGSSVTSNQPRTSSVPPPDFDAELAQEPLWKLRALFVAEAKEDLALND